MRICRSHIHAETKFSGPLRGNESLSKGKRVDSTTWKKRKYRKEMRRPKGSAWSQNRKIKEIECAIAAAAAANASKKALELSGPMNRFSVPPNSPPPTPVSRVYDATRPRCNLRFTGILRSESLYRPDHESPRDDDNFTHYASFKRRKARRRYLLRGLSTGALFVRVSE